MIKTKTKEFIEIEYVGRIQGTNQIFDLTDEELAKKEGIHNHQAEYGPKVICLGEQHILPALDKFLIGKEIGKEYKIELKVEEAFGKKNPRLIKIISANILRKQKIEPFPGLQINAGGMFGTIRSVTGGRVTLDFNHPLAAKNIFYTIKINKIIENDEEKLKSLLKNNLGLTNKDYNQKIEKNKVKITLKQTLPTKLKDEFLKKVKDLIPPMEVSF